ncbi:MAG: hypothetical protein JNM29_17965 [Candidatus Odyssella sp.]|nr:hypothetical protein [Candidatus Odyssella sp.]
MTEFGSRGAGRKANKSQGRSQEKPSSGGGKAKAGGRKSGGKPTKAKESQGLVSFGRQVIPGGGSPAGLNRALLTPPW